MVGKANQPLTSLVSNLVSVVVFPRLVFRSLAPHINIFLKVMQFPGQSCLFSEKILTLQDVRRACRIELNVLVQNALRAKACCCQLVKLYKVGALSQRLLTSRTNVSFMNSTKYAERERVKESNGQGYDVSEMNERSGSGRSFLAQSLDAVDL